MKLYIWTVFAANALYYKHSGITLAASKALAIANIMRDIKQERTIDSKQAVHYEAIEAYMNANDPVTYSLVGADYIAD